MFIAIVMTVLGLNISEVSHSCISQTVTEHAVYYVATTGSDENDGSLSSPFKTISKAATLAGPGDTVNVLPGIYRERVDPHYGGERYSNVVYRSLEKHKAIIKGSDIWKPAWKNVEEGIYAASPEDTLFTDIQYVDGGNPYMIAYANDADRPPYPYNSVDWTLGQVFVNDIPFKEVSSLKELRETGEAWWYNRAQNQITVNFGSLIPENQQVEITTRRSVFKPRSKGLPYITVEGFIFEHCGNQVMYRFWDEEYKQNWQNGMVDVHSGHHWIIKDNIIRYAKSIGLGIGTSKNVNNEINIPFEYDTSNPGYHVISGNVFYANGSIGIAGINHMGVKIQNNIFVENNYLRNTTFETGAIKTHYAYFMEIENNWFLRNNMYTVWLDNTWKNCRISRNVFIDNKHSDIFFELDDNEFTTPTIVDNNIFLGGESVYKPRGRKVEPWDAWSCGIYSHDADGLYIMHNLFAKNGYGIYAKDIYNRRGTASYRKVIGNMFVGDMQTSVCYPIDFKNDIKENYFYNNVYPKSERSFISHAMFGENQPNSEALNKIISMWESNGKLQENPENRPWGPTSEEWGYYLSFEQWNSITGFGNGSSQTGIKVNFDGSGLLSIAINEDESIINVESLPRIINKDYYNNIFDANPKPGPFQNINNGINSFELEVPESEWFITYLKDFEMEYATSNHQIKNSQTKKAYPNPARGDVTLTGLNSGSILKIYTMSGTLVDVIKVTNSKQRIPLKNIPSGLYILAEFNENILHNYFKFIKE